MTENELYTLVCNVIKAGLVGFPLFKDITVRQSYQPRITGAPTGSAVLLSDIHTQRYGFLKRESKWEPVVPATDPPTGREVRTERQNCVMTMQANAQILVPPAPKPLPAYTAGDLLMRVSSILQGDDGREALQAGGVGILRVTELRKIHIKNDQDQFQASPSFDFDLCYENVDRFEVPVVDAFEAKIQRV